MSFRPDPLKTVKKAVVTTLGQIIMAARKAGIKPRAGQDGRPYHQLAYGGGRVWIDGKPDIAGDAITGATVQQLVEAARKAAVQTRKDANGKDYYTLVFDEGQAYIETTTADDMKQARAKSPRSDK